MTTIWHGCYEKKHKDLAVPASIRHPAKMAPGLCERIFAYGQSQGWWQPGDLILDPFSGIFTTGLVGAYFGYQVLGIELEPAFYELGCQNIAFNKSKWDLLGKPIPVLVQGDSRKVLRHWADFTASEANGLVTSPPYADKRLTPRTNFQSRFQPDAQPAKASRAEGYSQASGVITSPPYVNSLCDSQGGIDTAKIKESDRRNTSKRRAEHHDKLNASQSYGSTPGQIGEMPAGVITSPPWSDVDSTPVNHATRTQLAREQGISNSQFVTPIDVQNRSGERLGYQDTPGQIANMPTGVITSPPFAGNSGGTGPASSDKINARYPGVFERSLGGMRVDEAYGATEGQINSLPMGTVDGAVTSPPYGGNDKGDYSTGARDPHGKHFAGEFRGSYGHTDGNAGDMPTGDVSLPETYWGACAEIYRQCLRLLRPGGVAAIVIKNYVKDGQIVDLVQQTETLLKALGWEHIETILASLVKETRRPTLFGDEKVERVERIGFFRRLYNKKHPENRIDYEAVICMRKPAK